jgi:hypothetical protein
MKIFKIIYSLSLLFALLSVLALPIATIYLLIADTSNALKILGYALIEVIILFAIAKGVMKLIENSKTRKIIQALLSILFLIVAIKAITSVTATSCHDTKYIQCDY